MTATVSLNNTNFRFNVVEYIRKLRNAGASQELAEVQAQEIKYIIEQTRQETRQAFDNKELATKGDLENVKLALQKEVAQSCTRLIIWMSSTFGGFSIFFLGVLAKGFHWI